MGRLKESIERKEKEMKAKTIFGAMRCSYCGGAILEVMRNSKTECPHCQGKFIASKIVDLID